MTFFTTVETASATAATTTSKITASKSCFGLSLALFEFLIPKKKEPKDFRSMIPGIFTYISLLNKWYQIIFTK